MTPSSAANWRCSRRSRRSINDSTGDHDLPDPTNPPPKTKGLRLHGPACEQTLDAIQNLRRNAPLALDRQRLGAVGPDDRDRIGFDVEPGIAPRHIVRDDEVGMLPLALGGGAGDD